MPDNENRKNEGLIIGVEGILRSLVRLLVNKVSLANLLQLTRAVYVEEAEKVLSEGSGERAVTLTRLALSTGLDTRTLRRIREQREAGDLRSDRFLTRLTPESAVIEAWSERVRGSAAGAEERTLDYGAESAGFEKLVRSTIATRGVTSQSIIQRLEATGSVAHDRAARTVTLLVDRFSPYRSGSHYDFLISALSAVSNLLSTIRHNEGCEADRRHIQRQLWSTRVRPEELEAVRDEIRRRLEALDESCRATLEGAEQERYDPSLATAGLGYYYFEDTD